MAEVKYILFMCGLNYKTVKTWNKLMLNYPVICCNEECGWVGMAYECLRWKHDTGEIFCPECREVVEEVC